MRSRFNARSAAALDLLVLSCRLASIAACPPNVRDERITGARCAFNSISMNRCWARRLGFCLTSLPLPCMVPRPRSSLSLSKDYLPNQAPRYALSYLPARPIVDSRSSRWDVPSLRQHPSRVSPRTFRGSYERSGTISSGNGEPVEVNIRIKHGCTVVAARESGVKILLESGVEQGEAESATEIFLEHATKLSRGQLRSPSGKTRRLSGKEAQLMSQCIGRRARNEPVQYILGEWDFCNLQNLKVRQPTLIPRPETEELVEIIIKEWPQSFPGKFLEVGSGSGAISIALLKEWQSARGHAVELCQHAVELTQQNAKLFDVDGRLAVHHEGVSPWAEATRATLDDGGRFDLLVSNPPYIPRADMLCLDPHVADFEDRVALDGGQDGLDVVWEILRVAPMVLAAGASIWLEVDESHPRLLADIFSTGDNSGLGGPAGLAGGRRSRAEAPGVELVEWRQDMFGRPRFVHFRTVHKA